MHKERNIGLDFVVVSGSESFCRRRSQSAEKVGNVVDKVLDIDVFNETIGEVIAETDDVAYFFHIDIAVDLAVDDFDPQLHRCLFVAVEVRIVDDFEIQLRAFESLEDIKSFFARERLDQVLNVDVEMESEIKTDRAFKRRIVRIE